MVSTKHFAKAYNLLVYYSIQTFRRSPVGTLVGTILYTRHGAATGRKHRNPKMRSKPKKRNGNDDGNDDGDGSISKRDDGNEAGILKKISVRQFMCHEAFYIVLSRLKCEMYKPMQ